MLSIWFSRRLENNMLSFWIKFWKSVQDGIYLQKWFWYEVKHGIQEKVYFDFYVAVVDRKCACYVDMKAAGL